MSTGEPVDPTKCTAYGCPMPGTSSSGTNGSKHDWLCRHHFGRNAMEWPHITAELNRLRWLAQAVSAIHITYGSSRWVPVARKIKQQCMLNQRGDLLPKQGESAMDWARRLDQELLATCSEHSIQKIMQPEMGQQDTWSKVNFEVPA